MLLTTRKTTADIIATVDKVMAQVQRKQKPVRIGGVVFEHAYAPGYCQQTVREVVEATVWNEEGRWREARCCAAATFHALMMAGYDILPKGKWAPGHLVYFKSTGKQCKVCGRNVGHAAILYRPMGPSGWLAFQNTSYEGRATCIIPVRADQWKRLLGVVQIVPTKGEAQAIDEQAKKHPYVIIVRGKPLASEDVFFRENAHWVQLRAFAEAAGLAVYVDDNKVYIEPMEVEECH